METRALSVIFEIDIRGDNQLFSITSSLGDVVQQVICGRSLNRDKWAVALVGAGADMEGEAESFLCSYKPKRYKTMV